jgi:hypothetical protein
MNDTAVTTDPKSKKASPAVEAPPKKEKGPPPSGHAFMRAIVGQEFAADNESISPRHAAFLAAYASMVKPEVDAMTTDEARLWVKIWRQQNPGAWRASRGGDSHGFSRQAPFGDVERKDFLAFQKLVSDLFNY